jgi:TfoX/Sxy family transcriptional regulator of competence genes
MAYNLDLEDKIDRLSTRLGNLSKKRMFGGVGYLMNGNMCFGIHQESLILRTSHQKAVALMESEYFTPFDITGKPMKGWVLVSPDVLETDEQLLDLLSLSIDFVKTLPAK